MPHTPGPWHTYGDGSGIAGPQGQPVALTMREGVAWPENAALIAGAPQMAEAGNTLAAYVYAISNPGAIPEHVKGAMRVFEHAARLR